ncbi:MAG: HlyD family efflux transporter periplasmic adaptor subunit [Gemmataceae bacterium]
MLRIRRWILLACLAGTAISLPACQTRDSEGSIVKAETATPKGPVEIGMPLFKASPFPVIPAATAGSKDSIVVPGGVVKFAEKQLVPAQVDGYIELIATQLPPGSKYDANDKRITFHPRDKEKSRIFRQLTPGMTVKKGDVVTMLDASQVEAQLDNSRKLIGVADNGIKYATQGIEQLDALIKQTEKAKGAVSPSELQQYYIQKTRFEENLCQSQQTQIKAYQDYDTAVSLLRKHQPTAAVTGIITNVFKRPGEFAKAGEPILEIQATDDVLIEGELPIQYFPQVKLGSSVRIESNRPLAENRELGSISHRREVSGIAVTSNPGRPLVVSAGVDGVALVWEPYAKKLPVALPHPVPVRVVAVTGSTAPGSLAATGSDDGKIRVWDLKNPDKLPNKADDARTMDDGHSSSVTALAFSPNGKVIASAAGREVILWDVASGKKMYSLPNEHKDAVTGLRFTPQCTLVTICRDKAVRSWNVGDKGAVLDRTIDHRAGVVDQLAVSSDGSRVLFDQDENRIDLVSLADGQSVGTIQAAGQSRFSGIVAFSSDDSLVITATGSSSPGELQLWETPKARGRGFERTRLITPGRATVTCAAFSPDPDKKFVVVGTATGGIFTWTPPTEKEYQILHGTVESLLNYNEKSAMLRVRVSNPPPNMLQDRGTANIIIDPDAVVTAPNKGATVPAVPAPVTVPASPTPAVPEPITPATATAPGTVPVPTVSGSGLGNPPATSTPATSTPATSTPATSTPTKGSPSTISPGTLPSIPTVPDPNKKK